MKIYILLSIGVFFISCNSTKQFNKENKFSENFDIYSLNGIYKNIPIFKDLDTLPTINKNFLYANPSLYAMVFEPYNIYGDNRKLTVNYEGQIQIKVLNEKEIEVSHIIMDTIRQQITLKGKMEGSFFYAKRKNIIGVPILWGAFRSNYICFSNNNEGNLKTSFGASNQGWELIFILSEKNTYETKLEFEKINNK